MTNHLSKAMWIALVVFGFADPHGLNAQPAPTAAALLQQGAIVHRRVTMLARRVQTDLRDSRRVGAQQRATCLDGVLSDLHSTQRALDAWTVEIRAVEQPNERLRGMLVVMRMHLKELRGEARGCLGRNDPQNGVVKLEVEIDGPQPDEDPHVVPQLLVDDVPWVVPQR